MNPTIPATARVSSVDVFEPCRSFPCAQVASLGDDVCYFHRKLALGLLSIVAPASYSHVPSRFRDLVEIAERIELRSERSA